MKNRNHIIPEIKTGLIWKQEVKNIENVMEQTEMFVLPAKIIQFYVWGELNIS